MSLVELKRVAQGHRIKMYYTKKRHELIRLLSMPELPDTFKIEKLTIVELRHHAKEKGLRGFWGLSRDDLVNLLYPNGQLRQDVEKKPENADDAEKCKDPQAYDSE